MATIQKAQTGARVYRGVGQSPNKGQVSSKGAQGYIKRELDKKKKSNGVTPVGGDGKSDNRSAVAAKSLARTAAPAAHAATAAQSTPPASSGGGSGGYNPNYNPAASTPQVTVNASGLLELPYNQSFAADQYAAVGTANQELLDLSMEEQQNNLDYATATRDAGLQNEQATRENLSGAGGSGTVFSSQYGQQVATQAGNYSNMLADLTARDAQFKSGAAQRRAAIQNSLALQLAASTQSYGDELGGDAGDLGYGTSAATPTPVTTRPIDNGPLKPAGGAGGDGQGRPARPSTNHVWRDGRWLHWSQTAAGKRGEKQPKGDN